MTGHHSCIHNLLLQLQYIDNLGLVLISSRLSCQLYLTTFGNLSHWVPGTPAVDRQQSQICLKCKSNCASFNPFTSKCGLNCLTEVYCDCRLCSLKYFYGCRSLTKAGLPAKLNSAQLPRQAGGQCLRQIMRRQ